MRRALLIAQEPGVGQPLQRHLIRRGFDVIEAPTAADAAGMLRTEAPDVLLVELRPTAGDGLLLLEEALRQHPAAVVAIAPEADAGMVTRAKRLGAFRLVERKATPADIESTLRDSLEPNTCAYHIIEARQRGILEGSSEFPLIGLSEAVRQMHRKAVMAARAPDRTVLIRQPPAAEARAVARIIHSRIDNEGGPLLELRCPCYSDVALETELFGAERDTSAGILHARFGLLEAAGGGTVFLDRIESVPLPLQARLLRALDTGTLTRRGGTEPILFQARLLASTECDLRRRTAEGRFNRDLFERLDAYPIDVPPLRERPEDILPMASNHLVRISTRSGRRFNGFSQGAMERLLAYDWPGNTRELYHVVARAALVEPGPWLQAAWLHPSGDDIGIEKMEDVEREHIRRMLERHHWKKTTVARLLGINRTTLWHKIRRYGLEPSDG